jgi:predicted nucleotidyltransferase component of viral defense system
MLQNELESYYRSIILPAGASTEYARNLLKEQLHFYILDFIYKQDDFRDLIFYGGTCLRHCFGLPRLSEDLDFEYLNGEFLFEVLAQRLKEYFSKVLRFDELVIKRQKFRLYLQFPILRKLQLAGASESDYLHVKIEVNVTTRAPQSYVTEIQPLSVMQRTFFVRRYDLGTLMASKINAIANRVWSKSVKGIDSTIDVKGRDYFDLLWYMQKKIVPRVSFTKFTSESELWGVVQERVMSLNTVSVGRDLQPFMSKPSEALDFARNLQPAFQAMLPGYLK